MRGPRLEKCHGFAASLTALLEGQNPRLDLDSIHCLSCPGSPSSNDPAKQFPSGYRNYLCGFQGFKVTHGRDSVHTPISLIHLNQCLAHSGAHSL